MTGTEFRTQSEWERTLAPGRIVTARWTNNYSYYEERAEVVRLNRASVRVRVLGGYLAGREIPVPRVLADQWSAVNGAFPSCMALWCD